MKKLLLFAIIFGCFLTSCHTQTTDSTTESNERSADNAKKISKRNLFINKQNAYNNLFLDSNSVETYISQNKIPDSLSRLIRSFYNSRNYEYAWFSTEGLTEQARGFWNLFDYAVEYGNDPSLSDKPFEKNMKELMAEDSITITPSDKSFIKPEINLTLNFIRFTRSNYQGGYVKRKEMEHFIPSQKSDAMELADSLLTKKHKDNKYFEDVNKNYAALKKELQRYYDIAAKGGWPVIPSSVKKFQKGMSSPIVLTIKKRLQTTGELDGADSSTVYDDALISAVKKVQSEFGYTQTGILTAEQVKDLNVPAVTRVQQILVNLGRMRWMPAEPEGNLIVVNIPEFVLHVYEAGKKAFDMNVVVGKDGHNTVSFTGDLNQIVFSPYWNVPVSIVKKEVMPKMAADPGYLAREHMEVTGTQGGIPVVRQLPGEWNSLGRVKFLFPNSYDIYFHDTDAKGLFSKDKRAYSHGCIRLSEPEKMADYLLRNDSSWPPDKINEAMMSGNQQFVKLKHPVPVFISYYTAWVDEDGELNFRDDIYSHDKIMMQKMF